MASEDDASELVARHAIEAPPAGHVGGDPQTPGPGGHVGGDPQTPGPGGHVGGDPQTPGPGGHVGGDPQTPGPAGSTPVAESDAMGSGRGAMLVTAGILFSRVFGLARQRIIG